MNDTSKILLMIFLLFFQTTITHGYIIDKPNQTDYNEGWEDGFCEGWKDEKGQFAICPIKGSISLSDY